MLILAVVIPVVAVSIGIWALASRLGAFSGLDRVSNGPRRRWADSSDSSDFDGTWPVRQLQRWPRSVLVGSAVVLSLWLVMWLIALAVGLSMTSG